MRCQRTDAHAIGECPDYHPQPIRYEVVALAGIPINPVPFTAPADANDAALADAATDALVIGLESFSEAALIELRGLPGHRGGRRR